MLFYKQLKLSDLDPRSPTLVSFIFSDITLPWGINQARYKVSFTSLVTKVLGFPRNLALLAQLMNSLHSFFFYASHLIPKEGQAKECITSAAETTNLVWVNSGIITLLSTSNILNLPSSKSVSGTI